MGIIRTKSVNMIKHSVFRFMPKRFILSNFATTKQYLTGFISTEITLDIMNIYDRAKVGMPIDLKNDKEYKDLCVPEMQRSRTICHNMNLLEPYDPKVRKLQEELFEGRLPKSSNILTPLHIDRGVTISIGENVFINWGLSTVSTGSITIEDNVQIAPNVSLLTANHDFKDLMILKCKPIVIKKRAWIGEGSKIMPGVTVGEYAVVASGSVVTKDVPPYTLVGGNPARFIKKISHCESADIPQ